MEIILLEHVKKLGTMGEVVIVKSGFARNFLIPYNKAVMATEENKKMFEAKRALIAKENQKRKTEAEDLIALIPASIIVIRQSAEDGKLFGSVTSKDVASSINELSTVKIAKGQVSLHNVIKFTGIYKADIQLHPEVVTTITINVARSQDEAEAAAAKQ